MSPRVEEFVELLHQLDEILSMAASPARFETGIADVDETGDLHDRTLFFVADARHKVTSAIRAHYDQ